MSPAKKSQYCGVDVTIAASISVLGKSFGLGSWSTERDAAIAYDRAVLHFGLDRPLNLPRTSKKLGAASPEQLKQLLREGRGLTNKYVGVREHNGRFSANLRVLGKQITGCDFPRA